MGKTGSIVTLQEKAIRRKPLESRDRQGLAVNEHALVRVQRAVGNRATQQLLNGRLAVSDPNDAHERQAQEVAEKVMRPSAPDLRSEPPQALPTQHFEDHAVQRQADDPASVIEETRSPEESLPLPPCAPPPSDNNSVGRQLGSGRPLPAALERFFEPRFGHSFDPVRLHTNAKSRALARTYGARAFTHGNAIVFGRGAYAPHTRAGKTLIAHELTHVLQQAGAPASIVQRTPETERQDHIPAATAPRPVLIVEDGAETLLGGQMRKSRFLSDLRDDIVASAEPILATIDWSTANCPYITFWYDYYSRRSAAHLERAIRHFVPEAANVRSSAEYQTLILQRMIQSVRTWVRTGEITGVPEDLPTDALALPADGQRTVAFKARSGGARPGGPPHKILAHLGRGDNLTATVKARMAPTFGATLNHVKTHTDAAAAQLADQYNAHAFAIGRHIGFAAGAYRPGSPAGDALIAHELAHVAQQRNSQELPQTVVPPSGRLEAEADAASVSALASIWGRGVGLFSRFRRNTMPSLRSGLSLMRCGIPQDYLSIEYLATQLHEELTQREEDQDLDRDRIFGLLDRLDPDEVEALIDLYDTRYARRGQTQVLLTQLRGEMLDSQLFVGVTGAKDLYRAYRVLGTNITEQDSLTTTAADRIEMEPSNAEVLPHSPVTYRMRVQNSLPPAQRFAWVVENDPAVVSEHLMAPAYFSGPSSRVWENAEWAYPGRHNVICMVQYGRRDTSLVRFFVYEQVVREVREIARGEFAEEIETLPSDIRLEQLAMEDMANRIRSDAIAHGFPRALFTAWIEAASWAVAVEARIRQNPGAAMPANIASGYRTKVRAFYQAFRDEVQSFDTTETIEGDDADVDIVTNPYMSELFLQVRMAGVNSTRNSWAFKVRDFYMVGSRLDLYARRFLQRAGRTEDEARLGYVGPLSTELNRLLDQHPNAIRIRAVFYPENQPLENTGIAENPQYDLDEIHLNFYVYREDDDWHLVDLTNPSNPIVSSESGESTTIPPQDLFTELNSRLRFPHGVLFWELPNGERFSMPTTEPWSVSDWLTAIGVGLAALAIGAATLGAGTAATVLIIGSGIVGAAAGVADIAERSNLGVLTAQSVVINLLSIISSLATVGTASLGRIVASGAMRTGTFARIAVLADRAYVPFAVAALGSDLVSVAVFAGTLIQQYDAINDASMPETERELAKRRLLQMALLTGGLSILAIRGGIPDIRRGRNLYLDPDLGRDVMARPLMSRNQLLAFARTNNLEVNVERLLSRDFLTDEMLLRIRADLTAAIDAPNINIEDIRSIVARLGRAPDVDGLNQVLAELRWANRLNYEIGNQVASRIYIGARVGNEPFQLSDDIAVRISPASEADALYLRGGTVFFDEVKNTGAALRQKMELAPQIDNMVAWRAAAGDGPPRALGVHLETQAGWTEICRPLGGRYAGRRTYALQELITNQIPLSIGPYRLSVDQMIELRDAILRKAREVGEFPPGPPFFDRIQTLEDAQRYLGITL